MKNDDSLLDHAAQKLRREQQPVRDLWPEIEGKLDTTAAKTQRWPYFAAVACLALMFIAGLSWKSVYEENTRNEFLVKLQQQHQQQMNFLYSSFEDQEALADNWQEQLAELEEAAQQILKALEEDPNNIDLLKMLKSVYQQKLFLVERVHNPKWQHVYSTHNKVAL